MSDAHQRKQNFRSVDCVTGTCAATTTSLVVSSSCLWRFSETSNVTALNIEATSYCSCKFLKTASIAWINQEPSVFETNALLSENMEIKGINNNLTRCSYCVLLVRTLWRHVCTRASYEWSYASANNSIIVKTPLMSTLLLCIETSVRTKRGCWGNKQVGIDGQRRLIEEVCFRLVITVSLVIEAEGGSGATCRLHHLFSRARLDEEELRVACQQTKHPGHVLMLHVSTYHLSMLETMFIYMCDIRGMLSTF